MLLLNPDALTEEQWEVLEVIAISYCWISPDHPDPNGYYLEVLAKMAGLFLEGKFEEEKKDKLYTVNGQYSPAWYLRDGGFSFGAGDGRPVFVFLDWTGVPQDKPHGSRTEAETAIFKDALKNINLWYAHSATFTWMLTFLPEGAMRTDYGSSGWTFFEFCVGALLSHSCKLLRIDAGVRERLLGGYWDQDRLDDNHPGDYLQLSADTMDTQRGPPLAPDRFNELVDAKTFTNGADADAIVKPKYLKTFNAVIVGAEELNYSGLGFDTEKARGVLEVVRTHCKRGTLKRLNLSQSSEREMTVPLEEWAGVAGEMALEGLNLTMCWGVSGDLASVAGLTRLTVLDLCYCRGVSGDLASVAGLTHLTMLDLRACKGVSGDLASVAGLTHLTVLNLLNCEGVSGDLASVAGLTHLTVLHLCYCKGVSGDLASVAGLTHLTKLNLHSTSVTAPLCCPGGRELNYPNAAACGRLLAWLNSNSPMRPCCCVLS